MATDKKKYPYWTKIQWDGNPDLNYECYRKSFGRGNVSVGIGKFTTICFDHGANSDNSLSSTRWHYGKELTEEQAMQLVDFCDGYHDNRKCDAFREKLFPGAKAEWNLKNPGK